MKKTLINIIKNLQQNGNYISKEYFENNKKFVELIYSRQRSSKFGNQHEFIMRIIGDKYTYKISFYEYELQHIVNHSNEYKNSLFLFISSKKVEKGYRFIFEKAQEQFNLYINIFKKKENIKSEDDFTLKI